MIVDKNTTPQKDLYYLGAKVIELLDASAEVEFDYLDTYQRLNEQHKISIRLFALVLDWLFILEVIKSGKNGVIEKCF